MTFNLTAEEEREYNRLTASEGYLFGESRVLALRARQIVAERHRAERKTQTLRELAGQELGVKQKLAVWVLWRWIKNGGLQRMADLAQPNWKTRAGGLGFIFTGLAAICTGLGCFTTAVVEGHILQSAFECWAMILTGAAGVAGGYSALGIGHKMERQIEATNNLALVTAAANPDVPNADAADATAAIARIKDEQGATSTPVPGEVKP